MTIYVDTAMIPARVGRHTSRWSHLVSDQLDPAELHEFAARIGLRRSWFQPGQLLGRPWPVGDHYDVTEGKRHQAIAAGAVELDLHGFAELLRRRRAAAALRRHRKPGGCAMSRRADRGLGEQAHAAELVARVRAGDREALGELYRSYRAGVRDYLARRMWAYPADVEDVVHETFILAAREAHTFDPAAEEVGDWLRGCLAQRALVDHRRRQRHPQLAAVDAIAAWLRGGPPESAHERESRPVSPRVVVALARLTPAQRRAVQLRYLDGLSEAAAAQVAKCEPGTIGSHTQAARVRLRVELADLAPTPTSWLHAMSKKAAIHAGFEAVGRLDGAAVTRWLRERGIRVAHQYVYQVLHGQHGPTPSVEGRAA